MHQTQVPCSLGVVSYIINLLCNIASQVFDLSTGQLLDTLRAHMDTINCCIFNPSMHELYSGSNDGNILVWRAALDDKGCNMDIDDDDDWSDA